MKKILLVILLLLSLSVVYAQTAAIEITDYEDEILIERGWVRYMSVGVKNAGETYLRNAEVSVEGSKTSWFELQTGPTDIAPNETTTFLIKLYVPLEEEKGDYQFSLKAKSGGFIATKTFTVEIFTSRTEMMLDQIQSFREKVNDLNGLAEDADARGKNVESVKLMLQEAQPLLDAASKDVNNRLFDDATEKIRDLEILLKKAEYDLSVASPKQIAQVAGLPLEWILIIGLSIIIISMFLWFFVFRRREKAVRIAAKMPAFKIKKMVMQEKKTDEPVEEIQRLEEAAALLEEEYREGLLSKESYEEMKSKYEEKILNMKTKK